MSNSIQFVVHVFDRLQRSTDFLWQKGYKEPEIKAKMILNFQLPRMELSVRKMNILFFLIKESFVEFANKFILRIVDWGWINVASTHLHLLWNNCGVSSSKQKQKAIHFIFMITQIIHSASGRPLRAMRHHHQHHHPKMAQSLSFSSAPIIIACAPFAVTIPVTWQVFVRGQEQLLWNSNSNSNFSKELWPKPSAAAADLGATMGAIVGKNCWRPVWGQLK